MITPSRLVVGALLLPSVGVLAVGCNKTEPPPSESSRPADTAPVTAPAATSAPATSPPATSPGTTEQASTGTTSTRGIEIGKWSGTNDAKTRFNGKVTCTKKGDALSLAFTIESSKGTFTIDFPTAQGNGEFKGYEASGKLAATGNASINAKDITVTTGSAKDPNGISFAFSVGTRNLTTNQTGSIEGTGACSFGRGGTDSGTGSGSGDFAVPVQDSTAFTLRLLEVAKANADVKEDAFGAPQAWVTAGLPKSAPVGSSIPATPEKISGFTTVTDKGGRFEVYPFAVMDTAGVCVFGFVYTTPSRPDPTTTSTRSVGDTCTGAAARDYFETNILE